MITEYRANINIRQTRDYFENFYSYVWNKHFPSRAWVEPTLLAAALEQETKIFKAKYSSNRTHIKLEWESDRDYTLFVLRWS